MAKPLTPCAQSFHDGRSGCLVAVLTLLWLVVPGTLFAALPRIPLNPERNGPFLHYVSDEAASLNSVRNIIQTGDGCLLLTTDTGLCRFQGVYIHNFTRDNTPELRTNELHDLVDDGKGGVWFTSADGLYHMSGDQFTAYGTADGLPSNNIYAITRDLQGRLWVATPKGLVCRENDSWRTYPRELPIEHPRAVTWTHLVCDREGVLWLSTLDGLVRFADGQYHVFREADGLPASHVLGLSLGRDGRLWIGTQKGVVWRTGGLFKNLRSAAGREYPEVNAFCEDPDGTLWLGSVHGLLKREPGQERLYTEQDGLSYRQISHIMRDREGVLWISTRGGGFNSLRPQFITSIGKEQGLADERTRCVHEARDGRLWISPEVGPVTLLTGSQMEQLSLPPGAAGGINGVTAMYEETDGTFWLADANRLHQLKAGRHRLFKVEQELHFNSLLRTRDGTLWIGSERGLYLMSPKEELKDFSQANKEVFPTLDDRRIYSLFESRDGSLWVGTKAGLKRIREQVPESLPASPKQVLCFNEEDQALWMGTFQGGLCVYKYGRFRSISEQDGLANNTAFALLKDNQGWFWMSSRRGIHRARITELESFIEGRSNAVNGLLYGTIDGMPSQEMHGSRSPSACKLRDGRLAFTTTRGLAIIDPSKAGLNEVPPHVVIQDLYVAGRPVRIGARLDMETGARDLRIGFSGISLADPVKVRTRFRLEGYDQEWREAGPSYVAEYTNLPPGAYRFVAQAVNRDGTWNREGVSLPIGVPAHVWEKTWFWTMLALTGALVLFGFLRWRLHAAARNAERLNQLVDERTSALRASEALYRVLAEKYPNGAVMLLDASRRTLLFEIGGLPKETHWPMMRLQDGAEKPEFPDAFAHPIKENWGKILQGQFMDFEATMGERTYEVRIQPVFNGQQGFGKALVLIQDVTSRKRAEAEIQRSARLESLGVLAGGIAHDFNNLLTGIVGNIQIARMDLPADSLVAQCLNVAEDECLRARSLSSQLLTFAKGGKPVRSICSVSELLKRMGPFSLRGTKSSLMMDFPDNLWAAELDSAQIGQVIQNILINADQAMPSGGRVELRARNLTEELAPADCPCPCPCIEISIKDQGPGIPSHLMGRLFEPYFTTKVKGNGLGLASSYSIVKAHGGGLRVHSSPGEGADFRIYLPAQPTAALPAEAAKPSASYKLSGKILVVDDEEPIRRFLQLQLQRAGARVTTAMDCVTAEAAVREALYEGCPFDLVLIDLTIPGTIGGAGILKLLQDIQPNLAGVVMSGYSDSNILSNPTTAGFLAGITKPFRAEEIIGILTRVLPRQPARE